MWPHRIAAPGIGRIAGAVLTVLACAGCAAFEEAQDASPAGSSAGSTGSGAIGPRDVEGNWSGDWGRLYLWTDGTGVTRGIYPLHVGSLQGTMANGVFTGWWCEAPTRLPPANAGEVELHFVRGTDGVLSIDGRWRYGATGDWIEGFDVQRVVGPIDKTTQARMDDTDEFCSAP
jgi:hypothetical protein